jgi:hypothetical protein
MPGRLRRRLLRAVGRALERWALALRRAAGDAPARPLAPQLADGGPPSHWLARTASDGPPAHWLARVRAAAPWLLGGPETVIEPPPDALPDTTDATADVSATFAPTRLSPAPVVSRTPRALFRRLARLVSTGADARTPAAGDSELRTVEVDAPRAFEEQPQPSGNEREAARLQPHLQAEQAGSSALSPRDLIAGIDSRRLIQPDRPAPIRRFLTIHARPEEPGRPSPLETESLVAASALAARPAMRFRTSEGRSGWSESIQARPALEPSPKPALPAPQRSLEPARFVFEAPVPDYTRGPLPPRKPPGEDARDPWPSLPAREEDDAPDIATVLRAAERARRLEDEQRAL